MAYVQSGSTTAEAGSMGPLTGTTGLPMRKFTIHPDEAAEGTVRHTPAPGLSPALPSDNGVYLDLFSPVKSVDHRPEDTKKQRVASPGRARPRISSQTFVKSPVSGPVRDEGHVGSPRNIALFPSTDDTDDTVFPTAVDPIVVTQDINTVPSAKKTRITWRPSERRRSRKSIGCSTLPAQPNPNAKVLADLRKMSTARRNEQTGGVLAAFRPVELHQNSNNSKRCRGKPLSRAAEHIETDAPSSDALREYDSLRRERKWITDSEQGDDFGEDIWLTSDSDRKGSGRARSKKPVSTTRPPARQTSRSQITSNGTMSTTGPMPTALHGIDGSTGEDEEAMQTSRSHVSASGNFSPTSNDVRHLFPRTSSLSPRKHKPKCASPVKRSQRPAASAGIERQTLREMTLNTAHLRQARSPWTKVKAGKIATVAALQPQPTPLAQAPDQTRTAAVGSDGTSDGEDHQLEPHCAVCGPTQTRVVGLEGEVVRLRGEVLALKAILRRNGLQVPKGLEVSY